MTEFAKSFLEQVPEQCRKCPVLGRFILLSSIADADAKRVMKDVADLQKNPNPVVDSHLNWSLERLNFETDFELEYTHLLAKVIEYVDDDCPGQRRGGSSSDSILWKVVAILGNERICRNPNFAPLQAIPAIKDQLQIGHWDPIPKVD